MTAKLLINSFEKEATATESGGKSGKSSACGGCVSKEHGERPNLTARDILQGIQSIGSTVSVTQANLNKTL